MKEPRNIVVILGNGFDLDLGLRTSYKDFWESRFCPKDYPSPLIHHLNQKWPGESLDGVRWYDLENELSVYYKNLNVSNPRFNDILSDKERSFIQNLPEETVDYNYYSSQFNEEIESLKKKGIIIHNPIKNTIQVPFLDDLKQNYTWRDRRSIELIKVGLMNHLQVIPRPHNYKYSTAFCLLLTLVRCAENGDFVKVFTFNYTSTYLYSHLIKDLSFHYVHGSCDNANIIIGTKDDLSIKKEYGFLQKVMDPLFNPPDIVTALKEADEVILFGHSLGENDRQYFAPFFKRQSSFDNQVKKDIIIFTRNRFSQTEIKHSLQQMTDGHLSVLYSINQPIIIKTNNLDSDKEDMYYFLRNHHYDDIQARLVIGSIINKRYL